MERTLFERRVMAEIRRYLSSDDIIVLHGARQVGKTSIMLYLQRELEAQGERVFYLDLEDSRLVAVLERGVEEFLRYLQERGVDFVALRQQERRLFTLVDEIQYLSNPSSFMKLIADHHHELKLIVSGSSSFEMKNKFRNSLVGRTVNFVIYPLSFREMLDFRGVAFAPAPVYTETKVMELQALYAEYALYGGYPKIVLTPDVAMKERYLQQIIDTYVRKDIRDLAEIKDVGKFNRLLEMLAAQSGNLLNIAELSNTCDLSRPTVERFLFLLEQTYVIRIVRPYSRNLRTELFKTPKVFLCDTGMMQLLWLKQLQREVLGPVFETSVFVELLKLYGPEFVAYWRTADKKEIDFIVQRPQAPLPVEVKLRFPQTTPPAVRSFFQHDAAEPEYRVVGLYGQPADEHMVYPWQLYL